MLGFDKLQSPQDDPPLFDPQQEEEPQHFRAVPPIWGNPEEWETEECDGNGQPLPPKRDDGPAIWG